MSCRYLNSTAAKFLFRADRILEAQRMAARFTKDGEQASNLYDMQCTWYEIECGNAHLRRKELGQVRLPCHPAPPSFSCQAAESCLQSQRRWSRPSCEGAHTCCWSRTTGKDLVIACLWLVIPVTSRACQCMLAPMKSWHLSACMALI